MYRLLFAWLCLCTVLVGCMNRDAQDTNKPLQSDSDIHVDEKRYAQWGTQPLAISNLEFPSHYVKGYSPSKKAKAQDKLVIQQINDLIHAIENKNVAEVKKLIVVVQNNRDHGLDTNVGQDQPHVGRPLLGTAIAGGSIDMVKLLLEAGADPNKHADCDFFPLIDQPFRAYPLLTCAVATGASFDIIKALVDAGADVNLRSFWAVEKSAGSQADVSALMVAEKLGRADVVHLLQEHGAQ